jgi:hypothetical protein
LKNIVLLALLNLNSFTMRAITAHEGTQDCRACTVGEAAPVPASDADCAEHLTHLVAETAGVHGL